MWRQGTGEFLPSPAKGKWSTHRRFLEALFEVATPQSVLDLSGGDGAALVKDLVADVDTVHDEDAADLVLASVHPQGLHRVAEGGFLLVMDWDLEQDCAVTHSVLGNGVAIVAPNPDPRWDWLLSRGFAAWSDRFLLGDLSEEMQWHRDRNSALEEAIAGQEDRIELLQRELLAARDEIQRLLVFEVSPKAQVAALRRSVPKSVKKRLLRGNIESARGEDGSAGPSPYDVLRTVKKVQLSDVLGQSYDPSFTKQSLQAYLDFGLARGVPVNAAHAAALERSADTPQVPEDLPPARAELVTATSRQPGDVAGLVERAKPKLLTIDVWDTLVYRQRPADCAKLATARRMVLLPGVQAELFEVMALRVALEAELAASDPGQEYELHDVVERTLHRLEPAVGQPLPDVVDALVRAEVDDEIQWSRTRADIAALRDQPNVVVASDFYMGAEDLGRVVGEVAEGWSQVPLYVSVDRGCSKRLNGGLLDLIRRDYGVTPAEHLHVGDNVHADIDVQVAAGGQALQVFRGQRFPGPGEFGPSDIPACTRALHAALAQFDAEHPTASVYESAGRSLAPLAVALVARGLEEAYKHGSDRVHYVSREGLFLSRVHEIVEPILRPPGVAPARPIHLALSRRATFGASLQSPFRFSLQRMWSMYARQSPRAMLVSIGVDPEEFAGELSAAGLTLDEMLEDARRDQRVERFLADPAVEEKLSSKVLRDRSLLRRYVETTTKIVDPFIVVDIGWRGTIQDNLVRALGIRSSIGVYFGTFPYLNAQPPGSRKIGVAFDSNEGEPMLFADPPAVLERPWTPDVPSTVGFEDSDGEVKPRLDKEAGRVSGGIREFQDGTLATAALVAEWMVGFGLTTTALRDELGRWAEDLWDNPPEGVADIWFDSDHDDSFGALNVSDVSKNRPNAQWLQGSLHAHLKRGMDASGWPAGYLRWTPVAAVIELARLQ